MTANDTQTPPSDNSDGDDDSSRDRWEYDGIGTGRAGDEMFDVGLYDHPTTAIVHPVRNAEIHLGLIVGDDSSGEQHVSADIHLSPDDAEGLALDLLESVAAAREARSDE